MCFRRVIICVVLAVICAGAAVAADQSNPINGITVIGYGEAQGKPDIARISLGVQTDDRVAATAAHENAVKNTAVINGIVKTGVAASDIQTVNYSISPKVDYKVSPTTTVGYTVSNEVRVKVRDLAKVGAVIDAALSAGANYSQNLTFSIENDTPLRQEALAKAARNAEAKAKTIADALGVKLGVPVSVVETGGQTPTLPLYRTMSTADGVQTPIMPGENRVTAGVTVVYSVQYAH